MDEQEALRRKLDLLNEEHRELDMMIEGMMNETVVNQLAIQRLKKRKLLVRDQITKIHAQMIPDIIA
jgi:hypothetical protein